MPTGERSRTTAKRLACAVPFLVFTCVPRALVAQQFTMQGIEQPGVFDGLVVDEHGRPVEGVVVSAPPIRHGPMTIEGERTDAWGHFRLSSVEPGWVRLTTRKEDDGYPNTLDSALLGPDYPKPPQLLIGPGETVSDVIVRVGPRCGTVVGVIKDATTGRPLPEAWAKFSREDDPEDWFSVAPDEEGGFRLVLPEVAYTLEVTAPHFKTWRAEDDIEQIPTQRIRVSNGVVLGLIIRLEPERPRQP